MSLAAPSSLQDGDNQHGYSVYKNINVAMRDGINLSVDVFLPFSVSKEDTKVPAICSYGPYGKDVPVLEFGKPKTNIYSNMYQGIKPLGPHACFELVDPALWTNEYGYAVVRADARGIGNSQGKLDPFGLERCVQVQADAEGQDIYDLIEWVGTQDWCNGKVATSGISYYGMVGYAAAMQKPPHLAAVVSYESGCDAFLSDRKGGIYSEGFMAHWYNNIVIPYQRGQEKIDYVKVLHDNEYRSQGPWAVFDRTRKLSDIEVPFYLAGNWSDPELHLPGNLVAFNEISSQHKWIEMHNGNHLAAYYLPHQIAAQKQFLDHFLLDKKHNDMLEVPRIRLTITHGLDEYYRSESAFPPPDAEETSFFLAPDRKLEFFSPRGSPVPFEYEGLQGRLTFQGPKFPEQFEVLGTPYLDITLSTEARDMDLFITVRAQDVNGKTVILRGNHDEPMPSFCRASFRLSHRGERNDLLSQKIPVISALNPATVEPGKAYEVIVPLTPTTYVFDAGCSFEIELGATDPVGTIPIAQHVGGDRTEERFGGKNTIFSHGRLVFPRVRRDVSEYSASL
ncbi:alpha/beta-hydrolase [Byssothecium circinans]|uniref:Alpha/beta-hydrolase n=1 Tax=Byssothecium circinans TaxID=147558 RepID=A0A6A5TMF8_9PLEO|nr:alpha/beta-hydrolase [Byssothecium circinans]